MNCSKCNLNIVPEDTLVCSLCKANIHFGCANMLETNFRKMAKAKKDTWKCEECKSKKNETFTIPFNDGVGNSDFSQQFKKFTIEIKNTVAEMEINLKKNTTSMETKIDEMIKQFDEMKKNYETILAKQEQLEKENTELKKKTDELKEMYEDRIDAIENRSRISNIEFRNIPETKGEDVVEIIQLIGQAIGIENIKEGDIQVAHRVDSMNKERGKRAIVAHMGSRYIRNKWLQRYRNFNSGKNGEQKTLTANLINNNLPKVPVYLNEHITVTKKILLKDAKQFARENSIKFVWIKDGFILMKKNETEKHVQKINTKKELEEYKKKVTNFSS
ncbi:hypothetical protein M8J76_001939 [Diaphorina citri]|nr:hypothetical protein M8J76_001939 [Diaphorina citri]